MSDIIAAFKESLHHIEWMDKESAEAAAEKVTPSSFVSPEA